jgi:YVTN family beta-propeller protein
MERISILIGSILAGLVISHAGLWDVARAAEVVKGAEAANGAEAADALRKVRRDRSPVDLALSPDGHWLVTANEESHTVSLINTADGQLADEIVCGQRPADIEFSAAGDRVLVTGAWSGDLAILALRDGRLHAQGRIVLGFEPCGLALTRDGTRAFVGLVATGEVAEVDLRALQVVRRMVVGHWPRSLALSPDGSRLAVGCSGEGKIAVIDTASGEVLYEEPLSNGLNLGHLRVSADGLQVYFPWMVYRTNPISEANIRRGWVLASRIGRVRLDGPAYREAISLDVPGLAVADPHGLSLSPDGQRIVVSAGGTHELLVYRLPDLPFVGTGGPGDLIDRRLQTDSDRFFRIEVGGRPLGLQIAADNRTVYVANSLRNSVQVVDLSTRRVEREIELGDSGEMTPARLGMALFYDGRRSLDQWYSCHSCHQEGGSNSRPMDTMNDGRPFTLKTVLPLYHVYETAPWTWHGWQTDLADAVRTSFTSTMLGPPPTEEETQAVVAYLQTLTPPPNPFRGAGASEAAAVRRGQALFESSRAGCATCHHGPYLTDGQVHDVGLGAADDVYTGHNTPTLQGVYRKVRLLHDGRARTLERVLGELHTPENIAGEANFSPDELADLIAYLKTL